ncbi:MAG: hypothetical protein GWP59_08125 [Chlamydiales bacterium]|nr:hypothetical protein [Chlamydiales bacterium]
MKVNDQIISIPPYISTTWDNIISVQVIEDNTILITLLDGTKVKAPGLSDADIKHVFQSHIKYVESEEREEENESNLRFALEKEEELAQGDGALTAQELLSKLLMSSPKETLDIPIQLGGDAAQGLGLGIQHNPLQKNAPNLPDELLSKVKSIAKIFADDKFSIPEIPDKNCNCFYCQIVRAIHEEEEDELDENEPVKDEELKFKLWDIVESGDSTFKVCNPLDAKEAYFVYLKKPMGCTCGKKDCEHIKAVLET